MKPDAVIVNTSRGEVIDENALTRMLRAGEIKGAGLDVYEHGTQVNPRLRELENVVLLPHMGSATVEGRMEMGEKVIINIKTFDDGHRPPDQVVPSMLYGGGAGKPASDLYRDEGALPPQTPPEYFLAKKGKGAVSCDLLW